MSCLSYTGGNLLLLLQDRPDATLLGKAISQADRFLRYSFEVFTAAMVIKVFYDAVMWEVLTGLSKYESGFSFLYQS